jgi:hypothetical protein
MSNDNERPKPLQKIQNGAGTGKSVALDGQGRDLREGVKPSAPANFALPRPIAIPPAPAASVSNNQEKKK